MPEADEKQTQDYEVLGYFHKNDKRTGDVVHYHPKGDNGWPGASDTFTGVPDSREVKELLDGAGGQGGPLIGERGDDEPPAEDPAPAVPGPVGPVSKQAKKTTLATAGVAGKEN